MQRVDSISIHPPRAGRDSRRNRQTACLRNFNPPAPCGAGRHGSKYYSSAGKNFNPPAPCGAGRLESPVYRQAIDFNPPAPCGAGRRVRGADKSGASDFNPPAPCGAGPYEKYCDDHAEFISIHPPRAGRDPSPIHTKGNVGDFNPPAPCGAGPDLGLTVALSFVGFQSTRPVRGGTAVRHVEFLDVVFQSTRPVRGGTLSASALKKSLNYFNPPAPCGAGQQSCTKFTPCILAQYTIQRAAKLLSAYQQAYFC